MKAVLSPWPAAMMLSVWLIAAPGFGQDYGVDAVPYPADSLSQPIVQAWINRYLPSQGYVVGAWSANVVMLVSVAGLRTDAYPQVTTEVLSEVLRPDAANAAGWRAAVQTLVFDCAQDQYKSLSNLYFARGDRKGGFDQDSGDGVWHKPDPGATMDTVERAACFYGLRQRKARLAVQTSVPATTASAKTAKAKPARVRPGRAKSAARKSVQTKPAPAASKRPPRPAAPTAPAAASDVTPQLRGFTLQ